MVYRIPNRTTDQIIDDFLSAKARTDVLGKEFIPSEQQRKELAHILKVYGANALSRSRKGDGLSKKTLENTIPRFLKLNLTNFVERLEKMKQLGTTTSWEFYCLAFGEDEAKKVWESKAKKCIISEERLGPERWSNWLESKKGSFLDRWKKEMDYDEATVRYANLQATLSKSKTLEGYIEKYGEEEGRQKYEKRYNNVHSKEYKTYARKVHRLSNKTYNENKEIINPENHPRTLCGVDGGWQLDHIMTIKECFIQGIPAEEASSLSNLRMLPWKDNLMRNYVNRS